MTDNKSQDETWNHGAEVQEPPVASEPHETHTSSHKIIKHPTDHPGREYGDEGSKERSHFASHAGRSHSSGSNNPSEPRRPGGGSRQSPAHDDFEPEVQEQVIPGEIFMEHDDVVINEGREITTVRVSNTADRPVQVGSHFHFAEVNSALDFDRKQAWGKRLNVLSGGAVRFEPGSVIEVDLIQLGGQRVIKGLRGLCKGNLDG